MVSGLDNELNSPFPCCQALWLALFTDVICSVTNLRDLIFRASLLIQVLLTDLHKDESFIKGAINRFY